MREIIIREELNSECYFKNFLCVCMPAIEGTTNEDETRTEQAEIVLSCLVTCPSSSRMFLYPGYVWWCEGDKMALDLEEE